MSVADEIAVLRAAAAKAAEVPEQVSGSDIVLDEVLAMVQHAAGISSDSMEVGAMIDELHNLIDEVQGKSLIMISLIHEMANRAEGTLP
jgi:hypothetical protein